MGRRISYWQVRGGLVVAIAALMLLLGRTDAHAQSAITSPAPGAAITGDVPIMGSATIDPFQKYELHYKLEPSGDDAYVYFDGGTSEIVNGQLGIWRAAGLPPGTYTLRLRVVKQDGNYAEAWSPNLSVNQGPAGTPTPDLSATPTITPTSSVPTPTFTPAPSPTPAIGAVEQPQLSQPAGAAPAAAPAESAGGGQPAPEVASTPAVVQPGDLAPSQASAAAANVQATPATSSTRALGEALSINHLRDQVFRGMRFSAALFLLALALYGGKKVFDWARRRYG